MAPRPRPRKGQCPLTHVLVRPLRGRTKGDLLRGLNVRSFFRSFFSSYYCALLYRHRMPLRFLGYLTLVTLVACGGSRETPVVALDSSSAAPAPSVASISSETAAPSAAPANQTPSDSPIASAAPVTSTQVGPPTAYPDEWIQHARGDNIGLSCLELVYKNGCSKTRTGIVTFQVTVDEDGSVVQFSEVDNQIRNDKAVVSRCLEKNMPRWKFHPPEGHEKTFQIPVALADRC